MSPYASVVVLILTAGALFMLPLIPAMVELHRKSDALPLSVIQKHTGEIRYFADSFRGYIKELEPVLQQAVSSGTTVSGSLPEPSTRYSVASGNDLCLPPDTRFSKDIYVGGRFLGGTKNRYRAILGEKEVHLGAESRVMRWVHAMGEFSAGPACQLHGRVSSDCGIRLPRECTFQRLNAPRIEFGQEPTPDVSLANDSEKTNSPEGNQRLLHDGDFEIAPGEVFHGNLVARGTLRIGSGARVCGDVKGDRGVVVESGARLEGSLISSSSMRVGASCAIHGPIIAEKLLLLESATRCGTPDTPTTVSAPWIQVEEGVAVFGTLWAREHGQVVARL